MEQTQQYFLQALQAALQGKQVNWDGAVDWGALFQMAQKHHVHPMIYEAVYACPAAKAAQPQIMAVARQVAVQSVMLQTVKTSEFQALYAHLRAQGLTPLVVKGLICRSLYPNPDQRMSSDEDLLIPEEQFAPCRAAMEAYGLQCSDLEAGEDTHEVPYIQAESPLYIELHRRLFSTGSKAVGDLNRFFDRVHDRAVPVTVDGCQYLTMAPTDHLFYLICHAFKHFLHSGFGIRQVCDVVLFANTWGREIDWEQILRDCKEICAEKFTAGMLGIGQEYLGFDPQAACLPACWKEVAVDPLPMLEDLLDAGVFGGGTMSRKHSSNITLSAVAAQKQGKKSNGVIKSLFPSAASLSKRYPYLKKKPWLLPVAWGSRIVRYGAEVGKTQNNDAAGAIQIGNARIELMKLYGILRDE